jgi:hypothetical protein
MMVAVGSPLQLFNAVTMRHISIRVPAIEASSLRLDSS